jgi:iron complex transport system substrate-binding protein
MRIRSFLLLLLSLCAAGCCRCLFAGTVVDALGRTVRFENAPRRVVIAGRGVVMIADALYLFPEASPLLVASEKITQGRGDFLASIDPGFSDKIVLPPEVGPEQIVALRPDTVILKSYMREKLGYALEALGVKVVYLDFETPSRFALDIAVLGQVFRNEKRASDIVSFYESRVKRVEDATASLPAGGKPHVLLLYYSERDGTGTFNVPPPEWMQTILVEMAGGVPIWKGWAVGKGWTKVGFEQIAAHDPEWVFVTAYFSDAQAVVKRLASDRTWGTLRAVRLKRLLPFPADYYSWDQPDPRWILGLLWLAHTLHPELYPDLDFSGEVRRFFREMYGLSDETYVRGIRPLLSGFLE